MNGLVLEAYLFDLDGVLVPTAVVHRWAWQELFDAVFSAHGWGPAYGDDDYFLYVDGRSRYDGVHDVLMSRGVDLLWGDPSDPPEFETVCGLANRKNAVFQDRLASVGVGAYPETRRVLEELRDSGLRMAVVSSSRNARDVLGSTGLLEYFDVVVDGGLSVERKLPGKPAPDTFWYAAERLGCEPGRCAVVEDALAGVAAGRAGGFGLVVGVDRGAGAEALLSSGADRVVTSLEELVGFSARNGGSDD